MARQLGFDFGETIAVVADARARNRPTAPRERRGPGPNGQRPIIDQPDDTEQPSAAAKAPQELAPLLIEHIPNVDIHLHSPHEAVANLGGTEPERTLAWMAKLTKLRIIKSRRVAFPTQDLDKFLCIRQPSNVTLDAGALAVARAIWARQLGWKNLLVERKGRRLVARSVRWPSDWRIVDAPWSAIAALEALSVRYDVDDNATSLLLRKLRGNDTKIAQAGLAGSAVIIETPHPELVIAMGLEALSWAGDKDQGRLKLPLLAAEPLLREPTIAMSSELADAITASCAPVRTAKEPKGFPWTLYEFQARDLAKAQRIVDVTGGVLLAGDMGSGKTTVSLAMIAEREAWPLCVVAPLAAFSTWVRQLGEMGKSAYVCVEPISQSRELIAQYHDAVIISYDRLHQFTSELETGGFRAIIADEVQRIRTPSSRRSRALRALAAAMPIRIGLSGTPITNRAEDILPLGAFLAPSEWPPRISVKDLSDLYPSEDPIESLAEHLGCLMVRRRMVDTGANLPDRTVLRVPVTLSPEQKQALAEMEAEAQAAKESGDLSNHIHVFARLQRMRQIVNIPSAAGLSGPNAKVVAAVDLAQEYSERGRKSVIFVADRPAWREVGAKLTERGIGWTGIWGSTSVQDRIANEKLFHSDDSIRVFIGTLASCAESLTLSPTATVTIFASLSYSPSAIAQAAARTYRMNQTNPVDEIYLHATAPGGTLDDRMYEILELKRELFAQIIDRTDYENPATKLSLSDLVYMLTGRRDDALDMREKDAAAADAAVRAKKDHARATLYKRRSGMFHDGGETALTRDEYLDRTAPDGDDTWEKLAADEIDTDIGVGQTISSQLPGWEHMLSWEENDSDDGFDSEAGDDDDSD